MAPSSAAGLPIVDLPADREALRPPAGDASGVFVTLIRPPMISSVATWRKAVTPPLGIAYLAAFLREANIPVDAVDAMAEKVDQFIVEDGYAYHGLTVAELLERIDPRTTHLGVSCMFTQDWPQVRKILGAIRERFPAAAIVAGGEHVTALPEWCLRDCPAIDAIVLGEGEETFTELCRAGFDRGAWKNVAGLAYLDGGEFVKTAPRRRIRDVDAIPRPAWDLLPVEVYLAATSAHGVYRGRSMGILATRGCPYKCTFCSNPTMYGTTWVARDVEDVLDEIQDYIDRYRAENIDFFDLTMIVKRSWILEFCRRIEERGMRFTWQLPTGTRSEVIDDEVAQALHRTGCRYIAYAPETGSQDTLVRIKKKMHLDKLDDSLRAALRNGLNVRVNLILGFPHETRRHIVQTMLFAWKLALLGVHEAGVFIFSPYPGTELFDELRAEGRIGELDDEYFHALTSYLDIATPTGFCRHVGGRELAAWRIFTMASFFAISFAVRPWRFVKLLRSVFGRGHKSTALETRLAEMVKRRTKAHSAPSPSPAVP